MTGTTRRTFVGGLALAGTPTPALAQEHDFSVGQEWDVRDLPEGHAIIGRIDVINDVRVIHAFVLHNGMPEFGEDPESAISYGHLAFTHDAFSASVFRLADPNAYIPEYFPIEYERWLAAPLVIPIPVGQFVRLMRREAIRRTT